MAHSWSLQDKEVVKRFPFKKSCLTAQAVLIQGFGMLKGLILSVSFLIFLIFFFLVIEF